jgi:phage protein U
MGSFKFESPVILGQISKSVDYGISEQERINNYSVYFTAKKEKETITLSGVTLPNTGAKNTALDKLYSLAATKDTLLLSSGSGKSFGRFIITSINENRTVFVDNGAFLVQEFTVELLRSGK